MSALNDKVVIVTGGSSGIGRAAALSFAEKGAKVVITGRRAGPLEATAADHSNIVGLVADAAAPDDAVRTIAKAIDTWGHLDVLVNNAGAGAILPLTEASASRHPTFSWRSMAGSPRASIAPTSGMPRRCSTS